MKTPSEFARYLEDVAIDLEESGMEATAADYLEAVEHIDRLMDMIYDMGDLCIAMKRRL